VSGPAGIFDPKSDEQVLRLVLGHPLAWIVSSGSEGLRASTLPLRPRVGSGGRIEVIEGHIPRSNPQHADLLRDGRALVLFMGPQGYISPSWVSNRTWAPTWNFAVAQFLVNVEFDETPARLDAHLQDLVETMERGRPGAWNIAEMGSRYETLKRMIVTFDAKVLEQRPRFKLGQDERDAVFAEIIAALGTSGAQDLVAWMRELNPGR
jgi:transcriptional regulator